MSFIITDQNRDFRIYPQYSEVKTLAADPNRVSIPEIKINRFEAKKAKLRAEIKAMRAWNKFYYFGGAPI